MSHKFIPGIASQSLGHPSHHSLIPKLEAASQAGFRSVELFYEDISNLTEAAQKDPTILPPQYTVHKAETSFTNSTDQQETELACCQYIHQTCLSLSLSIICLQPFFQYEGLLDNTERQARVRKLHYWIKLAHRLHTDLIQIPSNFLPANQCTDDHSTIITDLRTAADIGALHTPPIRFAYEALAWGTHINTWEDAFGIVQAVDRPNFGTCLDTFNITAAIYADPTYPSGLTPTATTTLSKSLSTLRSTLSNPTNLSKIFYIELCDGERLSTTQPLTPSHPWHQPTQPPRMTYSRNARLYPFETDASEAETQSRNPGYLPITQVLDVILDAGYRGYISFEVFNRSLNQPGAPVVREHAERARVSWERCREYIDAFFERRGDAVREEEGLDSIDKSFLDGQQQQTELRARDGVAEYMGISPRL